MKQKLERNFKHTSNTSRSAPTSYKRGISPINGLRNGLTELITPISGSEFHPYLPLPAEYLAYFLENLGPDT